MEVDRYWLQGPGATFFIYFKFLADSDGFSKLHSVEVVADAKRSHSIGDAPMKYGGVDGRVRFQFLFLFLPPIPAMSVDRGSSLTVPHLCCNLYLSR